MSVVNSVAFWLMVTLVTVCALVSIASALMCVKLYTEFAAMCQKLYAQFRNEKRRD